MSDKEFPNEINDFDCSSLEELSKTLKHGKKKLEQLELQRTKLVAETKEVRRKLKEETIACRNTLIATMMRRKHYDELLKQLDEEPSCSQKPKHFFSMQGISDTFEAPYSDPVDKNVIVEADLLEISSTDLSEDEESSPIQRRKIHKRKHAPIARMRIRRIKDSKELLDNAFRIKTEMKNQKDIQFDEYQNNNRNPQIWHVNENTKQDSESSTESLNGAYEERRQESTETTSVPTSSSKSLISSPSQTTLQPTAQLLSALLMRLALLRATWSSTLVQSLSIGTPLEQPLSTLPGHLPTTMSAQLFTQAPLSESPSISISQLTPELSMELAPLSQSPSALSTPTRSYTITRLAFPGNLASLPTTMSPQLLTQAPLSESPSISLRQLTPELSMELAPLSQSPSALSTPTRSYTITRLAVPEDLASLPTQSSPVRLQATLSTHSILVSAQSTQALPPPPELPPPLPVRSLTQFPLELPTQLVPMAVKSLPELSAQSPTESLLAHSTKLKISLPPRPTQTPLTPSAQLSPPPPLTPPPSPSPPPPPPPPPPLTTTTKSQMRPFARTLNSSWMSFQPMTRRVASNETFQFEINPLKHNEAQKPVSAGKLVPVKIKADTDFLTEEERHNSDFSNNSENYENVANPQSARDLTNVDDSIASSTSIAAELTISRINNKRSGT